MTGQLVVALPDALVGEIAERAAVLVLDRLNVSSSADLEFLSVAEAAQLLRCSRQRVYDLLSDGRLERFKDGSRVLVRRADLVAHLLPKDSRARASRCVAT